QTESFFLPARYLMICCNTAFKHGLPVNGTDIHMTKNCKNRLQIGIVAIIMPELWIKNEF
ncbi:hypothetical protein MM710_38115, partial [Klebsiella pneumoniae]|nr:hypothetical protein [Klebsiella pneumoniae]